MAHEQRPLYTDVSAHARAGSVVSQARHTPNSFLPLSLSTLSSWKFLKKLAISVTSIFPSSSLFSSFFSLFSISVSPHILCVCLSPEGSRATRLINNYRVHKIGKDAKKKKNTLSFDVQHERNQNYKETELYKEERKLAHSFLNPLLLFSAVLFFTFFLFYCLLCFCWGGFIASVSVLSL